MMRPRGLPRLSVQLSFAMLQASLLSIALILFSFAAFGFSQLPVRDPIQDIRAAGLEKELSKPETKLSITLSFDGTTRSIPVNDAAKKGLIVALEQASKYGFPLWVVQALVFGSICSVTFALLLAYRVARQIGQPIETVSSAAAQMGQGDLGTRAKIDERLGRSSFETLTLAQNFNTMAQALEASQQHRRDMTADIAHELRTPLGVMNSRLEALEDELIPFDVNEVQKLQQHTKLLIRLVEDLRILSLADSGQLEIHARVFDLAQIVRTVVAGFEARAVTTNVSLRLHVPENVLFSGDPDRITQVLSNLVSNALQHTPNAGEITVKLAMTDQILLSVSDTGSGIPETHLERIFDRFHRVDGSRSRASGGTGLGLAVVKSIVELHQGRITASNGQNGGALFTVFLPKPQLA
jgi:two-component system, OmpR family, sensor histidine kinase BaeS